MSAPKNLRAAMPGVTAWIDGLREAFGADEINALIKAGMTGVPVFHALEAGHEVGTLLPAVQVEISAAQMVIDVPAAAAPTKGRR